MADDKSNSAKKSVTSTFEQMSGGEVVRSAEQRGGGNSFPVLVHSDRGAVVLRLTDDCSSEYNAWTVEGDLPEPPFPTEDLFCNPNYTLLPIENMELTISGTGITLCVSCGIVSGESVTGAEAMMRWYEIGRR
jgi:hypothetical protein